MMAQRPMAGLAAALLLTLPLAAAAQRGRFFGRDRVQVNDNVPYDGRFTFARIRYASYGGWAYDYPTMETHLMTILQEITSLRPHLSGSNVHDLDDPELFKHPIAYLSEPGYWYPSAEEASALRTYLRKGGFLIVDDFHFPNEWAVFERAMRTVLPDARIDRLTLDHPIFDSFFRIDSLEVPYPGRLGEQGLMGEFYGIHQDNDPSRPLQVIINYDIDVGDYVEWSAEDLYNPRATNEAYKFAINYIIYGLTR
ncbi:MAG: DUF4159 domain-containing protein [Acidobacteria bacterium]|nr:DUF4159 domain-containing protein [Acidobacteriota bacterium]